MKISSFASILAVVASLALLTVSCAESEEPSGVDSITLSKSRVELSVGQTFQLEAVVFPDNLSEITLEWEMSDENVAVVDQGGLVTAISPGTAVLTVRVGEISDECEVVVTETAVSDIVLDKTSVEIREGAYVILKATVYPEDASYTALQWSSADPSVADVDQEGKVTGIKPGQTKVSVSAGGKTAFCDVSVTGVPVSSIIIDKTDVSLEPGQTCQLSATVLPENAYDKTLIWTSSDDAVATVSSDGLVTAVSSGFATITAASGNVKATCEISVLGDISVGDFYYSDGSTSSELNPAKTVVGVVFYVGNVQKNDAALGREHSGCSHGLVVALTEEKSAWQTNPEGYANLIGDWITSNAPDYVSITTDRSLESGLNQILGYNNTKAIELFNSDPSNSAWPVCAVEKVVSYREQVPAPSMSSDWYLPSIKELSLLCSGESSDNIDDILWECGNRDAVNASLAKIDGATPLSSSDRYWSSSESTSQDIYNLDFKYAAVLEYSKSNPDYLIRFVLAF